MKLDLGCGDNKREGFEGVDFVATPSTDHVVDLFTFPWPWADESVEEAHCSHFFEHVPAKLRPKFMDELYRVLQKGGKVQFITPMGDRGLQDFTHEWPPIVAGSFLYFNKEWRTNNKLLHGHYEMACDFDFSYGFGLDPAVAARNSDYQAYAVKFYNNAATDLHVTLTKR